MEPTPNPPADGQPAGTPRWVAQYRDAASSAWRVCAESPHRTPVEYALAEMTRTARTREPGLTLALWGPRNGAWHRYDTQPRPGSAPRTGPEAGLESGPEAGPRTDLETGPEAGPRTDLETGPEPAARPAQSRPSVLEERLDSRRRQILTAALNRAGLYDLTPHDHTAVQALTEHLDESAVRTVARWLATAAGGPGRADGPDHADRTPDP